MHRRTSPTRTTDRIISSGRCPIWFCRLSGLAPPVRHPIVSNRVVEEKVSTSHKSGTQVELFRWSVNTAGSLQFRTGQASLRWKGRTRNQREAVRGLSTALISPTPSNLMATRSVTRPLWPWPMTERRAAVSGEKLKVGRWSPLTCL